MTWSIKFLLILENSIFTACYLIFLRKLRDLNSFQGSLEILIKKADSQILSWADSKLNNTRRTTLLLKLLKYKSDITWSEKSGT